MEYNLENVFWISAIIGTTFFILKTATMFLGLGDQFDIDVDHSSDAHGIDNLGSVVAFKFLSLTGITTFLMMFGWGGLVATRQYQVNPLSSILFACVIGIIAVLVIAVIFKYALKLQSSGAEFSESDIIGLAATVYSHIPAEGVGRIQINVGGLVREMDAKSFEKTEIASYQNVEVVKMLDSNTVFVKIK